MISQTEKSPAASALYLFSYSAALLVGVLSTSFYYQYYKGRICHYALLLCLLILLIKELAFTRNKNLKYFLCAAVCLFLGFVFWKRTQNWLLLPVFPYLFCSHDVDLKKILKSTIIISSAAMFAVLIGAFTGIIENYVSYRGEIPRYYLGFRYVLFGPMILFNITACVVLLRKSRITYAELAVLLACNINIYMLTNARLSFFCALLLIIAGLIWKLKPDFLQAHSFLRGAAVCSFPLSAAVSIGFTAAYSPDVAWMVKLNSILGGRLQLGKSALDTYGVRWFGQKITLIGNGLSVTGEKSTATYNYIDCFYVQILVRCGIIFTAAVLIFATWALWRWNRRGQILLLAVAGVFAIHGIIDDLMIYLHYDTMWIVLGQILLAYDPPDRKEHRPGNQEDLLP